MKVDVLPAAAGATRLLLSPSGRYALAELGGEWLREEYGDRAAYAPPVLELIEVATGKVVRTATGWALGGPSDDGDQIYVEEHGKEFEYRVRSMTRPNLVEAVAAPDLFAMRGGESAGSRRIVVLEGKDDQLWLASIDPATLKTRATTTIAMAIPRGAGGQSFGAGIASGPSSIFLVGRIMESGWQLVRLDAQTLAARWRLSVPGDPIKNRALVVVGGAGQRVALVTGPAGHDQKVEPRQVHRISIAKGALLDSVPAPPHLFTGATTQTVPAPGRAAFVALHVPWTRDDGWYFSGVTLFDLARGRLSDEFRVDVDSVGDRLEAVQQLRPTSLACSAKLQVWLAPYDDRFHGKGRQAAAVKGLVTTPPGWHRDSRPRIRARDALVGKR
jgi:hypothetical protein